jgi:adenylate cyclase
MEIIYSGVILTCDIRNFTSYTYKMGCNHSLNRIENFISKLIEFSSINNSEVINLTGDGIILSFTGVHKEENAIKTALAFREIVKNLNKEYHKNKEKVIHIGIGIHKGKYTKKDIQIGEFKSTLSIGSSINISSKIEAKTKEYMVDILVTEEIFNILKNKEYSFLKMPTLNFPNISQDFELYWLAPQKK